MIAVKNKADLTYHILSFIPKNDHNADFWYPRPSAVKTLFDRIMFEAWQKWTQSTISFNLPVIVVCIDLYSFSNKTMKGSSCCAGLMRSCRHTSAKYGGGSSNNYGGVISQVWGGSSTNYGGVINQLWGGSSAKYGGGHQPTMGGASANYGGAISQLWGGSSTNYGGGPSAKYGGGYFPTSMYRKSKSRELF